MVKIALKFKASLENIQELNSRDENFRWYLKFSCSGCSEESDKWNYLSLNEVVDHNHGAVNHFVCKCKSCKRVNTVTIIEDSLKAYTAEDEGTFKTIAIFDCRGLNPIDFKPGEEWVVKAVDNGTEFEKVDLNEGSWSEYCEIIKQPVCVEDIEHKFEKVK